MEVFKKKIDKLFTDHCSRYLQAALGLVSVSAKNMDSETAESDETAREVAVEYEKMNQALADFFTGVVEVCREITTLAELTYFQERFGGDVGAAFGEAVGRLLGTGQKVAVENKKKEETDG